MYVTRVPNRGSPPAVLLRESYRENGKVKTRTLANLSRWPEHKVDKLQRALKGLPATGDLAEAFDITRSLPHGHVAAVVGTAEKQGMATLIDSAPSRNRDLVCAMLAAAVIEPGSKLAMARGLRIQTATSTLGAVLGVAGADEGTVKLVSCLVAAKIGGRDRCIVVVQGTPVPAGDHRPLRVAVSPVPAELS
jgi:hypothetical protein